MARQARHAEANGSAKAAKGKDDPAAKAKEWRQQQLGNKLKQKPAGAKR